MNLVKVYHKHRGMVFRVQAASKRLKENYLRQRALIRSQHIRQLEDEKKAVAARMSKLTIPVQKEFLQMRLQAIEQKLKEENTGY